VTVERSHNDFGIERNKQYEHDEFDQFHVVDRLCDIHRL
jgi:hypothetical protein